MNKYFATQLKRLLRLLPVVLCVLILLTTSIYLVYNGLVSRWTKSDTLEKFNIGLVGTQDEPMLQVGLEAVTSMDSSSMSIVFLEMDEETAINKLNAGQITAYVVFSEEFLQNALAGKITPLRFVSSSGSENIVSLVKDELTTAIATLLLSSEYGAFGLTEALEAYGYDGSFQQEHINKLAIEYAEKVLNRDAVYEVQEIGIVEGFEGISFEDYLLCGLSVVFLFLLTLPFVAVYSKDDLVMERLLKSRGVGAVSQTVCELGAYVLFFWLMASFMLFGIGKFSFAGILHVFPVAFSIAAISYLIYNLCRNLLSGVLVQMILSVAVCFVSGCFYPVYFFPLPVQKIAKYLPPAIAREHLASYLTDKAATQSGWLLLGIGFVCGMLCVLLRYMRITSGRGGKQ